MVDAGNIRSMRPSLCSHTVGRRRLRPRCSDFDSARETFLSGTFRVRQRRRRGSGPQRSCKGATRFSSRVVRVQMFPKDAWLFGDILHHGSPEDPIYIL